MYSNDDKIFIFALNAIFFVAVSLLFFWGFDRAIEHSIRQQDSMLCYSAKTSKNEEYTKKCQCYYAGQDISCINFVSGIVKE